MDCVSTCTEDENGVLKSHTRVEMMEFGRHTIPSVMRWGIRH